MAHFFFHFRDEAGLEPDDLGLALPNVEAAYLEAFAGATGLFSEMLQQRRDPRGARFEVADAEGHHLFDLPFSEVLASTRRPGSKPPRLSSAVAAQRQAEHMMVLTKGLFDEIEVARQRVEEAQSLLARSHVQRDL